MMEEPDRKNADEARGDGAQQRKKAYKPPELVKRGPLAKVAAVTPFIPSPADPVE
jgi:hypothetical protein